MSNELHLNRRRLLGGATAGAAAVALAACSRTDEGGEDGGGGSLLENAQDGGKIRVAYADEAPYAYTADDGSVTGQSVDVHTHLLDQLGIGADQIEWKLTEWNSLITGLGTNHDMVIAGMYITPERCEAVAFADPDYVMPDALLVMAGNPGGWTTLNDMADSDGVIGVMNGTSEQEVADQIFPEDRINVQPDLPALILELKAGRVDAVALTSANLRLAAEADDELEVTDGFWLIDPETGEEIIGAGAAVFQPNDADFRDALNGELETLLADTATWEGLVSAYGFTVDENHPEGLTAQDLCPDTYQ
ncbi:transporter substrate-binding domain-containing protein [Glycomyces sp. TRM65418]|uniref:transporter substrate-binding domain-containing protein n=1 Tax=Glycomyces sp. TRM65418 TaxID=2867006 RepID=UPI001CE6EB3B|nr:transporter substrate-binding domain-containing protein [Glycomyces sp. TRM65418]MCC3763836.1 transporter substrate-binding domain-containing protein [Glycomyces sp. TRM65418]QZD53540.1 transporter substrate-binding domain-containing protein [Glycomyces sp. TRM65418]